MINITDEEKLRLILLHYTTPSFEALTDINAQTSILVKINKNAGQKSNVFLLVRTKRLC